VNSFKSSSFILIGLGSIGKTHSKYILRNSRSVIVIDPNMEVLNYLKREDLSTSVVYFSSLESYRDEEIPEIAVIANWGPDHFSTIQKLVALGVKKMLVEKPLVSKLQDLEYLKKAISIGDLKIITNMPMSMGPLVEKIHKLQLNERLGEVQSITVTGGAKCLVTNGIHYIGLAAKVFKSDPVDVFSHLENSPINPRSKEFLFTEGTSSWYYGNGKNLTISFSNKSHTQLSMIMICEYGKIVIEDHLATVFIISTEKRGEIDKPARTMYPKEVLEEFEPYYFPSGLDGMGEFYSKIDSSDTKIWDDFKHGYMATEAVIGMLISSETKKLVELPLKSEVKGLYSLREWNIS
jgi:predicted dehydrogenase